MQDPVSVTVTGAAGQIGYALLFRIAAGEMFGEEQPIVLRLLEIPPAMNALQGVVMELDDCASPLVRDIVITDQPESAFEGTDYALLVGSRPRGPGMERKELIEVNAEIFSVQGKALNEHASKGVKVLVVGNPANTNCLIAMSNAPDIDFRQFTAMTRLDHNRAIAQLSRKTSAPVEEIKTLAIWGNHSTTMFPDITAATVSGERAMDLVDMAWYQSEFIPAIQQRGAKIIDARGLSSAASAANAAIDHMRDWVTGTDSIVSIGVFGEGAYDTEDGLIFSFPCTCKDGSWDIVSDWELNEFCREKITATEQELIEERDAISHLL